MNYIALEVHREDVKAYIDMRLLSWSPLKTNPDFVAALDKLNKELPYKLTVEDIAFEISDTTGLYIRNHCIDDFRANCIKDLGGGYFTFNKNTKYDKSSVDLLEIVRNYFKSHNPFLLHDVLGKNIVQSIHKKDERYFVLCKNKDYYGDDFEVPSVGFTQMKLSEFYKIINK